MNYTEILASRLKANRQILFDKNDYCMILLERAIRYHPIKVIILWELDMAEETVRLLEDRYPFDIRARTALELSRQWAKGEVTMPTAKKAIIACHAAAKDIESLEDIAHYHAVGQACSTIHTIEHAMGYPLYDFTAIVRKNGIENCNEILTNRINHYMDRLNYFSNPNIINGIPWAPFIYRRRDILCPPNLKM